MKRLLIAAALLVLTETAHAEPVATNSPDTVKAVLQAERDFAAYTKLHGYAKGFLDWSTTDAVTFQPEAVRIHDKLAKALADDPSLDGKPTPLRWGPFFVGAASSGDIAFDLGPWTIEGGDRAGWFFTIWNKQADGKWRWSVDGGAGLDTPGNLPAPDADFTFLSNSPHVIPDGLNQGMAQDDAFNATLAKTAAAAAYAGLHGEEPSIASDGVPPYIFDYTPWPETDMSPPPPPDGPARIAAVKAAALAARPEPGLIWTRDGQGAATSGDFVYTYGHASATDGSYVGHYVRVWRKLWPAANDWELTVDVFQK